MPRPAAGFTLLELIVVLFLLTTLVGLAVPSFRRSYRSMELSAEVRRLMETLRFARERAVLQRRPEAVAIDETLGAYWPEFKKEDLPERRAGWGKRRLLPENLKMRSSAPLITFFPDGTATEALVRLESREEKMELRIDPWLGRASCEHARPTR